MNNESHEIAVFGGGCFWCTETVFGQLKGIISVMPGYAGGRVVNPTYEQVLVGDTGHVESVRIEFDPTILSYDDLLIVFFNTHDPTTMNRQENDVGTQYASVIFYTSTEQCQKAEAFIKELNDNKAYDASVITEVRPFTTFYEAENYHRNYYWNHVNDRYCELFIAPKLEKVQSRFKELLK